MTFCLGVKVAEGLVGIADTRLTSGSEATVARKLTVHERPDHALFLMTAGLRSVRDKAVTYFEEAIETSDQEFDKLYKAVNAFAAQVRRVADEDKAALVESGLSFNLSALVGGQLERDAEHKLYLLYPQGNWVEVAKATPYFVIGESGYGKPLLDRAVQYETSMSDALKVGFLAFDATRTSTTDVGFPLDVVLYRRDSYEVAEHRYTEEDLEHVSVWWQERVHQAIAEAPQAWVEAVLAKLPGAVVSLPETGEGRST